jgi:hypothetical protein
VLFLQSIDAHRYGDVEVRAFFEDTGDVGKNSLLNLTVRHQVNRFQIVVAIKRVDNLGQVFAGKWLAAGQNQHAQVAAEGLSNAVNLMRLHLEFFAWPIVELVRKETVRAAHVAHAGHQDIQQHWRERLPRGHFGVTL